MRSDGFTLVELVVAAALLAIVSLLGLSALKASGNSVKLGQAQAQAQSDVRAVLTEMSHELEMAVKAAREDLPGVAGLEFRENLPIPAEDRGEDVDAAALTELVFQRAAEADTGQWTGPIIYRFINEDANKNGVLDANESDLDLNRRPTCVVLRLEDINGDGDFDDEGEQRVVGAASTITDLLVSYDGTLVTLTVESTRLIAGTEVMTPGGEITTRTVRSTQSCRIYPLN